MKIIFFSFLLFLSVSALFSQEIPTSEHEHFNFKLAFEVGSYGAGCKLAEHERIRKDNFTNYGIFGNRRYSLTASYFGIKPEFFVANNRLGIASGLRYTSVTSKYISGHENFLWKAEEKIGGGFNTSYYKISELQQKSHLITVPLEIRYFLNNRELPFQTYLKMGATINYRVSIENDVEFVSEVMDRHRDLVKKQLSEGENAFSSFAFTAIGFKIGKFKEGSHTPWINIEFTLPCVLLTNNSFAFAGAGIANFPGFGIQFSLQFPIGNNMPIGSK